MSLGFKDLRDYLIVTDEGWKHVRDTVPPICIDGQQDFPYADKRPLSWDIIELSPTRNRLRPFFEGSRGWAMWLGDQSGRTALIGDALAIHRHWAP
jgi:hypothetical protein